MGVDLVDLILRKKAALRKYSQTKGRFGTQERKSQLKGREKAEPLEAEQEGKTCFGREGLHLGKDVNKEGYHGG